MVIRMSAKKHWNTLKSKQRTTKNTHHSLIMNLAYTGRLSSIHVEKYSYIIQYIHIYKYTKLLNTQGNGQIYEYDGMTCINK